MVHKQILEYAERNSDASIVGIADEISGATPDLVERVLDRYGDPAGDQTPNASTDSDGTTFTDKATSTMAAPDTTEDIEVTDAQRTVLEAIHANPDATQQELGDELGVAASTISNRLNAIPGFDWENRTSFVAQYFETDTGAPDTEADPPADSATPSRETKLDAVIEQLTRVESQLETLTAPDPDVGGQGAESLDDAELVAKVVRACVTDEDITREEELRVIQTLTT